MTVAQEQQTHEIGSEDIGAPLYVAWQITNECNLACLHCIEESGPGKAFKDELTKEQTFSVLKQMADAQVPYISFSGGEPMVHPDFFEMVEYITDKGVNLKIETNGHYLTPENCKRLKDLEVKAVQVSIDGGTPASFNKMRVHGRFEKAIEGMRNLREAGVPVEVNFVPAKFNIHEVGQAVDLAFENGAYSFYSGKIMFTGNAVRTWHILQPSEEQYVEFFKTLHGKTKEYEGRMRVFFHELGLLEELKYRLVNPAALFIIIPNGKVKLINALPFTCGDLREQTLSEVWGNFNRAWKDPRVAKFVDDLEKDPDLVSKLHKWIPLNEPTASAAA
ncbi:MAG: radical SAM protein [Elusimicrobia bacterium]|nr:radical SAM protein [Elusimicrobiota bacterium]